MTKVGSNIVSSVLSTFFLEVPKGYHHWEAKPRKPGSLGGEVGRLIFFLSCPRLTRSAYSLQYNLTINLTLIEGFAQHMFASLISRSHHLSNLTFSVIPTTCLTPPLIERFTKQ